MLHTISSRGLQRTFTDCLPVRRPHPRWVPPCLDRKIGDFKGGVFAEPSPDPVDPDGRRMLGQPACTFHEPPQRRAQSIFGGVVPTSSSKAPCVPTGATADPLSDGDLRKEPVAKPSRVELDLDLFEPDRRDCVAMGCAGAIKDRGGTGDERLPDLRLVQIGANHEERKYRPLMGMLGHAGVAPIDDSPDRGSAEGSQHQISNRSGTVYSP